MCRSECAKIDGLSDLQHAKQWYEKTQKKFWLTTRSSIVIDRRHHQCILVRHVCNTVHLPLQWTHADGHALIHTRTRGAEKDKSRKRNKSVLNQTKHIISMPTYQTTHHSVFFHWIFLFFSSSSVSFRLVDVVWIISVFEWKSLLFSTQGSGNFVSVNCLGTSTFVRIMFSSFCFIHWPMCETFYILHFIHREIHVVLICVPFFKSHRAERCDNRYISILPLIFNDDFYFVFFLPHLLC